MIEAGLHALLVTDPTVANELGTRIYPVIWPDDPQFPLATYQLISTVTSSVFSGPLSLATVRLQYDCWGKTYSDVKAAAAACNAVLEGFQGTLPDETLVVNTTLDSSSDLYDSTAMCHRVSSDYLIQFYR